MTEHDCSCEILAEVLCEYIVKYGQTDAARRALAHLAIQATAAKICGSRVRAPVDCSPQSTHPR